MVKTILLAVTLATFALPALAQGAWDGATNGKATGNFTYKSKLQYKPVEPSAETLDDRSGDNSQGWTDAQQVRNDTHQQGFRNGDPVNGPHMRPLGFEYGDRSGGFVGSGGGSGATQGGPIIIFGRNTFVAPGNLALQTQNHSRFGGKLPPTHLDSFVYNAGNRDQIYGDEGTFGPPKATDFSYINSGIRWDLTTGHSSNDLPSAWGKPLKYGADGGPIQGN